MDLLAGDGTRDHVVRLTERYQCGLMRVDVFEGGMLQSGL